MNVAVIPARSGSKRIRRKNIREFCGKPIITWPISVAKKSGLFQHILISTDDEEIADEDKPENNEAPLGPDPDVIPGMSGVYVEKIQLDRLRSVVDHVREKLFGDNTNGTDSEKRQEVLT